MSWFYRHHEQDVGPFSDEEFLQRYRSGAMQKDTPARHASATTWQTAAQVLQHIEQLQASANETPAPAWTARGRIADLVFQDLRRMTLQLGLLLLLASLGSIFVYFEESRIALAVKQAVEQLGADGATISDTQLQAIQASGSPLIILILPIALASTVLTLVWTYRAARNVRVLSAEGLSFTPGWCVAVFFIPIVNLVAPFLALREIAKASVEATQWAFQKPGILVYLWWPLSIASGVFSQMTISAMLSLDGAAQIARLNQLSGYSLPFVIALNMVSFLLFWQIALTQANQVARAGVH